MPRSCSKLMVATSASARPMRMSAGVEGPRGGAEQVQRADDLVVQPHGQGLHGGEPGLLGGSSEPGPALRFGGQVGSGDGPAHVGKDAGGLGPSRSSGSDAVA
jgi:hypothetical protein